MHALVRGGRRFVLVGSVRDDGPLPDVITDVIEGQRAMRAELHDVGFTIMIATMLHSIATGNLLPASVPLVSVDINPATVTKLADRGQHPGGRNRHRRRPVPRTARSRAGSLLRRWQLGACEVSRADQTRVGPELSQHEAGGRAVATPGQRRRKGGPGGVEEELARLRQPAADDEDAGIQQRREVGKTQSEPAAQLVEAGQRGGIPVGRRSAHHWPVDALDASAGSVEQPVAEERRFGGDLTGDAGQGPAAGVLLPAAPVAAPAPMPPGLNAHVPGLGPRCRSDRAGVGHQAPALRRCPCRA